MTSSDMLDTALAVQTCQAIDLLLAEIDDLTNTLRQLAEEHRGTLCLARTHGRGAEPTTFWLKLAGFFAEFRRSARRLAEADGKWRSANWRAPSAPMPTIDPRVENFVAAALSLTPETVATQAVARDRHASVMTGLAILAGAIERLATELRHLQRQEVEEVAEGFSATQKGSSAMPP
ncbi:lyase family protein [Rhizobium beringeri]